MKAALLTLLLLLALAGTARAQELSTCSAIVGYVPVAADGITGGSTLCRTATGVDLLSGTEHGALDLRLEQMLLPMETTPAQMLSWTYIPAPGTPVGTADHFTYRLHHGEQVTAPETVDIRITAPAPKIVYATSALPALTVAITSRRRPLRLTTRCAAACTISAVARWRGRVVARTQPAVPGPLVLAVPRRARRVTVVVTAAAPGGAVTTEQIGVTLRG